MTDNKTTVVLVCPYNARLFMFDNKH